MTSLKQKTILIRQHFLYSNLIQWQNLLYWWIDSHQTFTQVVTVNQKLCKNIVQSTLVISKSMGDSEKFRDILTSTYQICRIEEKINWITTFHKWICNLTGEVRDILKNILKKRRRSNLSSFPQYFVTCCKIFMFKQGPDLHFEKTVIRAKQSRDNESWLYLICQETYILDIC